jgi:FlaA1/EpsC-like NDP-sugar epimerase
MELARQMIELSGYKPDGDIKIKITGLRPGEKLFEELSHCEKTHVPTEHPRIFELKSEQVTDDVEVWLDELRTLASGGDPQAIKQTMNRLEPEYTPFATARSG